MGSSTTPLDIILSSCTNVQWLAPKHSQHAVLLAANVMYLNYSKIGGTECHQEN